jgi:hypothetical protein
MSANSVDTSRGIGQSSGGLGGYRLSVSILKVCVLPATTRIGKALRLVRLRPLPTAAGHQDGSPLCVRTRHRSSGAASPLWGVTGPTCRPLSLHPRRDCSTHFPQLRKPRRPLTPPLPPPADRPPPPPASTPPSVAGAACPIARWPGTDPRRSPRWTAGRGGRSTSAGGRSRLPGRHALRGRATRRLSPVRREAPRRRHLQGRGWRGGVGRRPRRTRIQRKANQLPRLGQETRHPAARQSLQSWRAILLLSATACTLTGSPKVIRCIGGFSHCLHDCFDCSRLERKLPDGTLTHTTRRRLVTAHAIYGHPKRPAYGRRLAVFPRPATQRRPTTRLTPRRYPTTYVSNAPAVLRRVSVAGPAVDATKPERLVVEPEVPSQGDPADADFKGQLAATRQALAQGPLRGSEGLGRKTQ